VVSALGIQNTSKEPGVHTGREPTTK
jgi:hypothetical protein